MTGLILFALMFINFSIPPFFRLFVFCVCLCYISTLFLLLRPFISSPSCPHTLYAPLLNSSTCHSLGSVVSCNFSFLLTGSVCRSHVPVSPPPSWHCNTSTSNSGASFFLISHTLSAGPTSHLLLGAMMHQH